MTAFLPISAFRLRACLEEGRRQAEFVDEARVERVYCLPRRIGQLIQQRARFPRKLLAHEPQYRLLDSSTGCL